MSVAPPWNASWTGETRYEVRPCRWASGLPAVWQPHAPGEGVPIFAAPHMVRQRRAVAKMLCTVCGEPTKADARWMFPLGHWRAVGSRRTWLSTETPVHRGCADHAMAVCPHIRALGLAPALYPEGAARVVASYVGGPEVERDFGLVIPPNQRVIGSLKLHLPDWWVSKFARSEAA